LGARQLAAGVRVGGAESASASPAVPGVHDSPLAADDGVSAGVGASEAGVCQASEAGVPPAAGDAAAAAAALFAAAAALPLAAAVVSADAPLALVVALL
jgi:hypothetical protein